MSLEFIIIPFGKAYSSSASDVELKLKNSTKLDLDVTIDTNYTASLHSRLNKWFKHEYDVITIDEEYNIHKIIVVRFCDNNYKAQAMHVDEFIELVASYVDEDEKDKSVKNNEATTDDVETNLGGCCIS